MQITKEQLDSLSEVEFNELIDLLDDDMVDDLMMFIAEIVPASSIDLPDEIVAKFLHL